MALTVTLYATTNSTNYPLAFLASAVGGRIYPIVAPFDQPLLPGQGNPRKYAFIGDVSPQGNIPTMMEILNEHFHLTVNQPVPSLADMTARWATQVGDHYLATEGLLTACQRGMLLGKNPKKHHCWTTGGEEYSMGCLLCPHV